jgi:hypothetical protein
MISVPVCHYLIREQAYVEDRGIADDPYGLAAEDFEAGEVRIPTEEDRCVDNIGLVRRDVGPVQMP